MGRQNGVYWKDIMKISTFRVWAPVMGTFLNWLFWRNSWLTIEVFLKVPITSPIMVPYVSQDLWCIVLNFWFLLTSRCVAKFRFVSVFKNSDHWWRLNTADSQSVDKAANYSRRWEFPNFKMLWNFLCFLHSQLWEFLLNSPIHIFLRKSVS